jgi:hypothetical protein
MEIYWSSDEMLAVSFSGKCMSQNRFPSVLRFLHFTGNKTDNMVDKICPVYDYGREQTIQETLNSAFLVP